MARPHGKVRRGAIAVAVSLALAFGTIGLSAAAAHAETYRHKMLDIVNRTRTKHDLRPVKLNTSLSQDAHHWSRVMLRKNRLYDPPNLDEILSPYRWNDIGADVVGCGSTLHEVHKIMMTEDFHRTIILNTKVRRVGIGVVRADTKNRCGHRSLWVTEFYYG